jgi:hypothetical protein
MPFINWCAHWIHLASAIIWLGGLFFYLMILLPSLKDIDPAQARRLSQIVAMRLRAISLGTMAGLLLTGLFMVSQILQGVSNHAEFFDTPYGRALGAKLAIAVVAMLNGLYAGFVLAPRLVTAIEAHDEVGMRMAGKTIGLVTGINFLLGILITVCVAILRVNT